MWHHVTHDDDNVIMMSMSGTNLQMVLVCVYTKYYKVDLVDKSARIGY